MTKISDERLAEMLAYTPTHADNKADRVFYRELRLIIRELQQLRAHNSDSAEPVAWTCIAGYDGHFWRTTDPESGCEVNAYTGDQKTLFERRRSALASPPAKEDDRLRDLLLNLERYHQMVDGWGDEVLGVKQHPKGDYVKWRDILTIVRALTNRTPDDEVGNG